MVLVVIMALVTALTGAAALRARDVVPLLERVAWTLCAASVTVALLLPSRLGESELMQWVLLLLLGGAALLGVARIGVIRHRFFTLQATRASAAEPEQRWLWTPGAYTVGWVAVWVASAMALLKAVELVDARINASPAATESPEVVVSLVVGVFFIVLVLMTVGIFGAPFAYWFQSFKVGRAEESFRTKTALFSARIEQERRWGLDHDGA